MSFKDDDFMLGMERLQFKERFNSIAKTLKRYGWKVKLVIWKDDGETWEVTPVSTSKTQEAQRATTRVEVTVKDV